MGLFEQFPYSNFHELNLDWVLKLLKELDEKITNFVSINSIKYANPLQWDITNQYGQNTVVVDKNGNAYLSVQPVPAGVELDNTNYWTIIGNFSELWKSVKAAISPYDEEHNETASVAHIPGDWVWLADDLYYITANMNAGDKYIEGSNCTNTNIMTLYNNLKKSLDNSNLQLQQQIQQEATARQNADSALNTQIVNETTAREKADAELESKIAGASGAFVNVKTFGAIGNANFYNTSSKRYYTDNTSTTLPHDDTDAFTNAINYAKDNNIHTLFIPKGNYYLPNYKLTIKESEIRLLGDNGACLVSVDLPSGTFLTVEADGAFDSNYAKYNYLIENITVKGNYFNYNGNDFTVSGIEFLGSTTQHRGISKCAAFNFSIGFKITEATESRFDGIDCLLCNTAIYFTPTNLYNPTPLFINNLITELCYNGIYAPNKGFSKLYISNSGIGATRPYVGRTLTHFSNLRCELDLSLACDNNGNALIPCEILDGGLGILIDNGFFLFASGAASAFSMWYAGNIPTIDYKQIDAIFKISATADSENSNVIFTMNNVAVNRGNQPVMEIVQNNSNGTVRVSNYAPDYYAARIVAPGSRAFDYNALDKIGTLVTVNDSTITVQGGGHIDIPVTQRDSYVTLHIEPTTSAISPVINKKLGDKTVNQGVLTISPNDTKYNSQATASVITNIDTIQFYFSGDVTFDKNSFWISVI